MFLGSVGIKLFQRREHEMVPGTAETEAGGSRRGGGGGSSQEDEVDMDGSLWSKLPEDLLLSVLARLPLESLARLEQVCKAWKALWQNHGFLHLHSEATPSSNSWFIFQHKHQSLSSTMKVDCYDTHNNRWHELRFNHLPQIQQVCATAGSLVLCVGKIRVCRQPTRAEQYYGMVRYQPPSYKFLDMIVLNPLKPNAWERIPERIGSYVPHVGIVADEHTGTYKVILASLEKTEIFDSRHKSWKVFDSILSPMHDVCSSPVQYRGRLLFLGVGANGQGKVFVYNLEDNTCSSFDNLFSRDPFPRFGYLENCGGRLLMVRVTVTPTELGRCRELQQRQMGVRFERNFQLRVCEYVHAAEDLSGGVWRELTSIPMLELERSMSVNSKEGADFLAGAASPSSSSSSSSPSPSSSSSLSSTAVAASFASSSRNDLLCFTMGMKDGKLDCTNCVDGRAVFLYSLSQNRWCFVGERPEWAHEGVICLRSLQFQPSLHARFSPP